MAALDPIEGISLERYADLCAKMKDCGGDLEVCASIAQQNGVDRAAWQAAMDGWNHRMQDPATAGEVALAYMPLYQAALASATGGVCTASFEDYVGMSAMVKSKAQGLDTMYLNYGIDVHQWSQISTYWVDRLLKEPELGQSFHAACFPEIQRLDAGGAPPAAGQGHKPDEPSADQVVKAAGAISSLPPVAVGENCFVLWTDGTKYQAQVQQAGDRQCLVAFSDGQQQWIPNDRISSS